MSSRTFRLYDTLTRQLKPLATIEPGHLKFYSCGPTIYSYAHIGNFRTFLTADLIVRTAKAIGWKVSYVSNITDVGHLTQDDFADAGGEDKLEKALHSPEGKVFANIWDLSEHYAYAFCEDWKRLNLLEPTVRPRATQHMREQILAIQELVRKGIAYETLLGVYFDVKRFGSYGELSGNKSQDQLRQGVRDVLQDPGKRHSADFALWKKDEKHLMQWFSPWGWGFPGWHIECSAMSMHYLGETYDLHGGGEDLIFPHHECEIAQSESLTGKPLAHHWVHTRFLQVEGEKMSKSRGNFYTVRDLLDQKHVHPLALRYALIAVPYDKPLNFTLQSLNDASQVIERLMECQKKVKYALINGSDHEDRLEGPLKRLYDEALDAMCEDLNTSVALAKIYEMTRVILRESEIMSKHSAKSGALYLQQFNDLLGIAEHEHLHLQEVVQKTALTKQQILAAIEERDKAKKERDFDKADSIRKELIENGVELRDTPDGTIWKFKPILF